MIDRRAAARLSAICGVVIALSGLTGCGSGDGGGPKGGGPVTVGYVVVKPTSVAEISELSGRTTAYQVSEVRPQVTGLIRRRLFREGAFVRQGQPLFEIDGSLYRAAANQASANLASARANAEAARIKAERYRPLADMEAVSKQDYTDALASSRQAGASVAQTNAALTTARINLRFTTVPAPISGRIGRSLFTEGALVSATQPDPLAVIQRLDPIFVDIQQSSADLLTLRRALMSGGAAPASTQVRLKLEDGSDYGFTGTVQFSEAVVDPATGTSTLRASFPNLQGLLLPGMFVRATLVQAIDNTAFLVPQQAVTRDPRGNATVYVVGRRGKAEVRTIRADRTQGAFWVVTEGLKAGDRVITQGLGTLKPGAEIKPVPATQQQRVAPRPPGEGGGRSGGSQRPRGG